jgi:trigger factor
VIDFLGTVDDVAFEGGSAEDHALVLGSGSFIPGFEEQLVGAKVGEDVAVTVTFPENYGAAHLAGERSGGVGVKKRLQCKMTPLQNRALP